MSQPESPKPEAQEPAGRSARRLLWVGVVGVVMAAAFFLRPGGPVPGEAVTEAGPPLELQGRWTTEDTRYDGRALEITVDSIVFHRGQADPATHPLHRVRVERTARRLDVTLIYGTADGEAELGLTVGTARPQVLRLRNLSDVAWTRSPEPGEDGTTPPLP